MRWPIANVVYALLLSSAIWTVSASQQLSAIDKQHCEFSTLSFSSHFASGRLDGCEQSAENHFMLHLKPENLPINPSPWYAFEVRSSLAEPQRVAITLVAHHSKARYQPMVSTDQQHWSAIPFQQQDNTTQFTLEIGDTPLFVSAGEIINNTLYTRWLSDLAAGDVFSLGYSVQGRAIPALEHRVTGSNDWLILIGRQHPPEISGALGLLHFNNLLWSDDAELVSFRARYNILLVPNMNPDGVYHGNWRHNRNGVDLNRDWKTRTQPETMALHNKLKAIESDGGVIRFALDFHSTWRNVYYTMNHDYITASGKPLTNPQLVNNWLALLATRLPYPVDNVPSHNQSSGVFKQYIADEYGVHSVTYEVGDNTDRQQIQATAEAALRTLILQL